MESSLCPHPAGQAEVFKVCPLTSSIAITEDLLEVHFLRTRPRPAESQALGGAQRSVLCQPVPRTPTRAECENCSCGGREHALRSQADALQPPKPRGLPAKATEPLCVCFFIPPQKHRRRYQPHEAALRITGN